MKLDSPLAFSKRRPWKERKAKIDCCRIECVGGLIQVYSERVVDIKLSRFFDEHLCKVGIDAPVAYLIGVGQSIAGDLSTDAHVISFLICRTQARLDIPQALPISELRKSHA
jgi:hypothetical protein